MESKFINNINPFSRLVLKKGPIANLNDVVVDVPQVATAEHRIRAICRVVANASQIRINFFIDDGHLETHGLVSKSHIEKSCLQSR